MAGAGIGCHRHRPVPGGVVARALALDAADASRDRAWHLLSPHRGGLCAAVDVARAEPRRGAATTRSQFRLTASTSDRNCGRNRGPERGFLFHRSLARAYRTRLACGQDAESRHPSAPARAARSLGPARLSGGVWGWGGLFLRWWAGVGQRPALLPARGV